MTSAPLWREGQGTAKRFVINDQGMIFLTPSTNESDSAPDVVWTPSKVLGDRMVTGDVMYANQRLRSPAGSYELIFQTDGNLVLYRTSDKGVIWASKSDGKAPRRFMVQLDGNVVLYVDDYRRLGVAWASATNAPGGGVSPPREFVLRDNGDLVILENGKQIYSLDYKRK